MSSDRDTTPEAASPPANGVVVDTATKMAKRKAAATDLPELQVDLSLPEPPSKRAKRALKKGKTLPAKPHPLADSGDEQDKDGKSGKGKPAKEERSQFGIWIGNLAFTVSRQQLFQWFVTGSGGAISEADITRINLPMAPRRPGSTPLPARLRDADGHPIPQNKGFAYVDFATFEAQVAATALSETELDGRRVLIKDSKSFEGRPKPVPVAEDSGVDGEAPARGAAAAAGTAVASTATKIFVGNLGFETTEEDLRRHFAPCGTIAWAKVATFPDNTEKCRGYGWVQFALPAEDSTTPTAPAEAAAAAVRGFVRIKETLDTEADFVAEAEDGDDAADAAGGDGDDKEGEDDTAEATAKQEPRYKMRKWWVNMLKGRALKVQFAEDDQLRYKKRFRKGPPPSAQSSSARPQQEKRPRQEKWQPKEAPKVEGGPSNKPFKYQDLSIAQRTGAVTASLGKKTILE